MKLKEIEKIGEEKLKELINSKENFVLYVRSEKDSSKIKEIFDVDIVFPELANAFGDKVSFFWCDIDEVKVLVRDLGIYFAPMVVLFKEGSILKKLEGIKSWAEYTQAVGELIC